MAKVKLKDSLGEVREYEEEHAKRILIKNRKDLLRKPPATSLKYEKVVDEKKAEKTAKDKD